MPSLCTCGIFSAQELVEVWPVHLAWPSYFQSNLAFKPFQPTLKLQNAAGFFFRSFFPLCTRHELRVARPSHRIRYSEILARSIDLEWYDMDRQVQQRGSQNIARRKIWWTNLINWFVQWHRNAEDTKATPESFEWLASCCISRQGEDLTENVAGHASGGYERWQYLQAPTKASLSASACSKVGTVFFFQMIAQLESFSMFQPWIWRPGCIGCLWSHRPCSIWCLPLLQWHWPLAACLGHRCYQVMQCTFVICKQDWCTYTYQSNWRLNRTI